MIHPDLYYVTVNELVQVLKEQEEQVGVNGGMRGICVKRHEYCN